MSNQTTHLSSHPWSIAELSAVPQALPVPEMNEAGVKAIYYDGTPYEGRPTRVFAYYALPEAAEGGSKVPAMVLVHGGGGTAFKEWVRIWADRGYAAIAMDLEGHLPLDKDSEGKRPQHEWSGPSRQGEFGDYALPIEEQWMYHAVAAVIKAHSFIRSLPQVDPDRIGIHGISWGGIVTGIVSGVDSRFAFAIPVYGCGYLYESSNKYGDGFARMPEADAAKIKRLWDPSAHLPNVTMPMLWVNGDADAHFPLHLFSKSFETARSRRSDSRLSIQFGLRHSHAAGWKPEEIYTFADQMTRGTEPLLLLSPLEASGNEAAVRYSGNTAVRKAELRYANDTSDWFAMNWAVVEAEIVAATQEIRAVVPDEAKAYFFLITDERDFVVCSEIKG